MRVKEIAARLYIFHFPHHTFLAGVPVCIPLPYSVCTPPISPCRMHKGAKEDAVSRCTCTHTRPHICVLTCSATSTWDHHFKTAARAGHHALRTI